MPVCEILPRIFQITMPTPFAVGDVHAYLLLGEALTLVDTGLRHPPGQQALSAALATIGVAVTDLQQIVLSHSHLDHFGLARRLQDESGAEVLAHPIACPKLADLKGFVAQSLAWTEELLPRTGLPDDQHAWVRVFYGAIPQMAEDVRVGRCLEDGDRLAAGGSEWQVLFCPGHSGDLICLYRAADGVLLGSDHLLAHISSNALLEPPHSRQSPPRQALIEYWHSLERIDALPITRVLPGHGEIIADHRSLLAERRRQRDRRLARILALTAAQPLTAWEIAQGLFPNLGRLDIFLALSEVIGHLDMLQADGRVTEEQEGERLRYRPAA